MNCPSCGTSVEADQQFCRSCGTGLLAAAPRQIRPQVVMLMAILLTFIGIVVALGGTMAELQWLKFTGVFIALAGLFSVAAGSLIIEMRSSKRPVTKKALQPLSVERADTTNKLLPVGENDFVPSVVENTTELLQTAEPQLRK